MENTVKKQINRGIPMSVKDNKLQFKLGKSTFGIQIKDRFQFVYIYRSGFVL